MFRKAKEEGRDPEEALREFLQSGDHGRSDDDDSDGDEGAASGKRRRKRPSGDPGTIDGAIDPPAPGESSQSRKHTEALTICASKSCMNLMNPHVNIVLVVLRL